MLLIDRSRQLSQCLPTNVLFTSASASWCSNGPPGPAVTVSKPSLCCQWPWSKPIRTAWERCFLQLSVGEKPKCNLFSLIVWNSVHQVTVRLTWTALKCVPEAICVPSRAGAPWSLLLITGVCVSVESDFAVGKLWAKEQRPKTAQMPASFDLTWLY